jgi:hypothetical protein
MSLIDDKIARLAELDKESEAIREELRAMREQLKGVAPLKRGAKPGRRNGAAAGTPRAPRKPRAPKDAAESERIVNDGTV